MANDIDRLIAWHTKKGHAMKADHALSDPLTAAMREMKTDAKARKAKHG